MATKFEQAFDLSIGVLRLIAARTTTLADDTILAGAEALRGDEKFMSNLEAWLGVSDDPSIPPGAQTLKESLTLPQGLAINWITLLPMLIDLIKFFMSQKVFADQADELEHLTKDKP